MRSVMTTLTAAVLLLGAVGCKASLYDRLGGRPAIEKVVDTFLSTAAPDPEVNFFRKDDTGTAKFSSKAPDVERLRGHLINLFGTLTGGPEKYTGRSMAESHKNMKITEKEFNKLAGHLADALAKNGVKEPELGEVMTIAASTKGDIVGK